MPTRRKFSRAGTAESTNKRVISTESRPPPFLGGRPGRGRPLLHIKVLYLIFKTICRKEKSAHVCSRSGSASVSRFAKYARIDTAAYLVHRIVPRCGKSRRISLRAPLLYKCRSASVHNNFTHSRRFTPYRVNFHPLRFFYTMLCNASGANLQNCRHPRFAHLLFPAIRCIMHIGT